MGPSLWAPWSPFATRSPTPMTVRVSWVLPMCRPFRPHSPLCSRFADEETEAKRSVNFLRIPQQVPDAGADQSLVPGPTCLSGFLRGRDRSPTRTSWAGRVCFSPNRPSKDQAGSCCSRGSGRRTHPCPRGSLAVVSGCSRSSFQLAASSVISQRTP